MIRNFIFLLILPSGFGTYSTWDVCFRQKAFEQHSFQKGKNLIKIQDHLYDNLVMGEVNMWFLIILSPVALLQALFLFFLYLKHKELRLNLGDIFMGSLFYECLYSSHMYIQTFMLRLYEAVYRMENNTGMINKSFSCQSNSVLAILGQYGSFFYAVIFFYSIRQKILNSLNPDRFESWMVHLTIMGLSWIAVLVFVTTELTGKTLDGMCGIQFGQVGGFYVFSFFGGFFITYSCIGGLSIIDLHRKASKNLKKEKLSSDFSKFTSLYFLTYLILMIIIQVTSALGEINCQYTYNQYGMVFYSISDVISIWAMILLPVIRCQEPYTKSCLEKILQSNKSSNHMDNDPSQDDQMNLELTDIQIKNQPISDEGDTNTSPIQSERSQISFNSFQTVNNSTQIRNSFTQNPESTFVQIFQKNSRTRSMFNIVSSIIIDDKSKYHSIDGLEVTNIKSEQNIFEEKVRYNIQDDQIFQFIPDIPPQSFIEENKREKSGITMTSYAPIIFHSLLSREEDKIKLQESLDLISNLPRIRQCGKNNGGKSGSYFFYSWDNKLIIKTISYNELKIFIKKLQDYYTYMQGNKNSLITKVYGIFTYQNDNEQPVHLMMMKNVAKCNKSCILRSYDLKGSSYDREVVKKQFPNQDLTRMVLKDKDFIKLEKYLNISEEDRMKVLENTFQDANFFKKCGLIDYSLIIIKVDWTKVCEQNPDNAKLLEDNNQHVYKSTFKDNTYYHVGIIDYLQEYDVQKKMEKYSKKFIKLNKNLDTSSQDALKYATRFQNFVESICVKPKNELEMLN